MDFGQEQRSAKSSKLLFDSPLYLYPPSITQVPCIMYGGFYSVCVYCPTANANRGRDWFPMSLQTFGRFQSGASLYMPQTNHCRIVELFTIKHNSFYFVVIGSMYHYWYIRWLWSKLMLNLGQFYSSMTFVMVKATNRSHNYIYSLVH